MCSGETDCRPIQQLQKQARYCKKLKGTNFPIFEDFREETASISKEKWKEVLKNQKDGKISCFQYKTVICKERPRVS